MNEINSNTRTLIVGFVLAIMVLIPLRFVEVGQMVGQSTSKQVLGVETVSQAVTEPTKAVLEEPYQTIENTKVCITKAEIDSGWADLKTEAENKQMNQDQISEAVGQLVSAEENICK